MFNESNRDVLINALTIRRLKRKQIVIGTLTEAQHATFNMLREEKGWEPRNNRDVVITRGDVYHMLKRIDNDGLTPAEVVSIMEHALSDDSIATRGDEGRPVLTNLNHMEIDGKRFGAKAIFKDRQNNQNPTCFGVIPKGWGGRK